MSTVNPRNRARLVWTAGVVLAGASVLTTIGIAAGAPSPQKAAPQSVTTSAPTVVRQGTAAQGSANVKKHSGPTDAQKAAKAAPAGQPEPLPTKHATLEAPAVIASDLVADVVRMTAVKGLASAPGEVAGPAVRFTIRISNRTGRSISLANTVVSAYYGPKAVPAIPLEEPGGRPFPTSVGNGKSASGSFVFGIPTAQRDQVTVSVDTSVRNPVVAFKGAAPR